MERFDEGLRCQDVHAGLRNVDPAAGVLRPLMDTRLVGMAATLASLIRGQDVIAEASALQAVAAEFATLRSGRSHALRFGTGSHTPSRFAAGVFHLPHDPPAVDHHGS